MALTVDELLTTLKKSRLLSEKQLGLVEDGIKRARQGEQAKPLAPESITRKLVRERLITEWHAKMLLQKQSSFHLGQYVLQKSIGKGGMGKVFKARDRKNKRDVAIKVLSGKLAKKPKLVARFRREVEVASQLNSPYIVKAFDAGEVGNSHFMVMEYVKGESIEEVADRLGRMRTEHACEITRQAAMGLKFAHEQGMVHRDIKPANMMVAFEEGQPVVRLLDMGLARFEKADNDGMTKTGQVMGTPDYMAPEQGWNTADVDIRADIYSLGCTMFRLVTGQVPFPGDNPLQVLMARCSIDAPLASSIVPDIDPRVDAIVRSMTWRDPSRRYQTPEELLEALSPLCVVPTEEELAADQGLESPPAAPTMVMDSTNGEPSFQEFLRDVGSGANVTLMQGSFEGLGVSLPGASTVSGSGSHASVPAPEKKKLWPLFASVGLIAALLVLGALILFPPGGDSPGPDPNITKTGGSGGPMDPPPPPKVQYFADIPVQRVEAGQVVGFFAPPEHQTGLDGVTWELGEDAPKDAHLTASNGEFFWTPPLDQKPGRLTVTLLAKRGEKTEATKEVFIDISASALDAKILEFDNVQISSGQPWEYQLKLFGIEAVPPDAKFLLAGDPPDGLKLDEKTGLLSWTPPRTVFGRIPIGIQLIDKRSERVVHNAACSVFVNPSAMVERPRKVAIRRVAGLVGQMLVVNLKSDRPAQRRARWFLTQAGRDKGATLNEVSGRFEWTPAEDMIGEQTFEIELKREDRIIGQGALVVDVAMPTAPKPAKPTNAKMPDEQLVATAEKEIKQVFKREFASKSSSTKRNLAMRLLMLSYDDNPPAKRYALLKLAMEVAQKSRAFGAGCEIAQRLQTEFEIDSVSSVIELVDGFKTRAVSKVDLALLGEGMFRECLSAAESNRFGSATRLMKVANTIARKSAYEPVCERALELLKALPDEDPEDPQQAELTDQQDLSASQLIELLTPYQFEPIFRDANAVTFTGADVQQVAAVRKLWKFDGPSVSLKSPPADLSPGFIDPDISVESFVLRMHVKADTTSARLVFGASGAGRVNGYRIPLVGAMEFSVYQTEPQAALISKSQGRVVHDKSGWDLVEVTVFGQRVSIIVNGNLVTEARLPEPASGTVGILSSLEKAGEHKVHIRGPRLFEPPAESE